MTGPDHYLYAESSVKEAFTGEKDVGVVTVLLARAQVHATLALTAATAARDLKTRIDWVNVLRDRGQQTIAKTEIGDDVKVSTVFLATDYGWHEPPILFETMIFGGEHDQYQWQYATRAEAEAGHARIVAAVEAGEKP